MIQAEVNSRFERRADLMIRKAHKSARVVSAVINREWQALSKAILSRQYDTWGAAFALGREWMLLLDLRVKQAIEIDLEAACGFWWENSVDLLISTVEPEQLAAFAGELFEAKERIGLRGLHRIKDPPNRGVIAQILNRPVNGLTRNQRLSSLSGLIANKGKLIEKLAAGMARGDTPSEIRDAILPLVNNYKTSAERIVRTEMRRVANAMQDRLWLRSASLIEGFYRRSQRDNRVRPEHVFLDGEFYRWGDPRPSLPDAPNCRCFWVPKYYAGKRPRSSTRPRDARGRFV